MNFHYNREWLIVIVITEEEADWVKDVPEGTEIGEEGDAPDAVINPVLLQVGDYIFAKGRLANKEVIIITEAVDILLIMAEQGQGAMQRFHFIQIQMPHEDAGRKSVFPRCKALVEHVAVIQRAAHLLKNF